MLGVKSRRTSPRTAVRENLVSRIRVCALSAHDPVEGLQGCDEQCRADLFLRCLSNREGALPFTIEHCRVSATRLLFTDSPNTICGNYSAAIGQRCVVFQGVDYGAVQLVILLVACPETRKWP